MSDTPPPDYDQDDEGEDVKLLRKWVDEERQARLHRERMAARDESEYERTVRLMSKVWDQIQADWRKQGG